MLFGPGSIIQGAVSVLICQASIKAYSFYAPFREAEDDYLQELTQWQLFMVLLGLKCLSLLNCIAQFLFGYNRCSFYLTSHF